MFPYLRRKVELCCFMLTRQVYSQRHAKNDTTNTLLTKIAARLLEVRCRLPVQFFFLFTWNVEFLLTFPLLTFKRSFSKKRGKTPSSHIIHSLGGEYSWIVRDSEPIRLLKAPRSLSVYILTVVSVTIAVDYYISGWYSASR